MDEGPGSRRRKGREGREEELSSSFAGDELVRFFRLFPALVSMFCYLQHLTDFTHPLLLSVFPRLRHPSILRFLPIPSALHLPPLPHQRFRTLPLPSPNLHLRLPYHPRRSFSSRNRRWNQLARKTVQDGSSSGDTSAASEDRSREVSAGRQVEG